METQQTIKTEGEGQEWKLGVGPCKRPWETLREWANKPGCDNREELLRHADEAEAAFLAPAPWDKEELVAYAAYFLLGIASVLVGYLVYRASTW